MLDDRTKGLLLALLYPVQFETRPELGIDRVMQFVVGRHALHATPSEYLRAIETALESRDEKLAEIIPQTHSEDTIRAYLRQLANALVGARASPAAAGPLATS